MIYAHSTFYYSALDFTEVEKFAVGFRTGRQSSDLARPACVP